MILNSLTCNNVQFRKPQFFRQSLPTQENWNRLGNPWRKTNWWCHWRCQGIWWRSCCQSRSFRQSWETDCLKMFILALIHTIKGVNDYRIITTTLHPFASFILKTFFGSDIIVVKVWLKDNIHAEIYTWQMTLPLPWQTIHARIGLQFRAVRRENAPIQLSIERVPLALWVGFTLGQAGHLLGGEGGLQVDAVTSACFKWNIIISVYVTFSIWAVLKLHTGDWESLKRKRNSLKIKWNWNNKFDRSSCNYSITSRAASQIRTRKISR